MISLGCHQEPVDKAVRSNGPGKGHNQIGMVEIGCNDMRLTG